MKKQTKKQLRLQAMIDQIDTIVNYARQREKEADAIWEAIHPSYRKSVVNLLHYRAFRSFDLRDLQKKLGYIGFSRMANSQVHVMASLLNVRAMLMALLTKRPIEIPASELSFKQGVRRLDKNTKAIFGERPKERRTRIMVTMPSEAAEHPALVDSMLNAGMNCARINCAHDTPEVWEAIIQNIRNASEKLQKPCKVAMDLAGPKIRTGPIKPGPPVLKLRPVKDVYGMINEPLKVWLGPEPKTGFKHIPLSEEYLMTLTEIEYLYLMDTRGKKRKLRIIEKSEGGYFIHCFRTTYLESGLPIYLDPKRTKEVIRLGDIPSVSVPLILKTGDQLQLDKAPIMGENALWDEAGKLKTIAHISCTAPAIFDQVKTGERILFDDGKIEGVIEHIHENDLSIKITRAAMEGSKLRADKGINLPDSQLTISGLTEKDKGDLPFVVAHADIINFSFVNRPEDVKELNEELDQLNAKNKLAIVLKIETKAGYNRLTDILLEAMKVYPVGVMIARGDLAVESGWENIGQEQEEILSICNAAHVTDIWATQVLEGLAKNGLPSRAEITDAVASHRADCVMLNKGPHIVQAIQLLDTILKGFGRFKDRNKLYSPKMERI